jgi:transposase
VLNLPDRKRIFVATQPIHACLGVDGLAQIVRDQFGEDPISGDLFCFFNRRRNRVKILVWDRNGFWVLTKRLEFGCFEKVNLQVPRVELDRARLSMLLEEIEVRTAEFRPHFRRTIRTQRRPLSDGSEPAP